MTTLLFARHGQASFGHRNYDQLSELGKQQSALLGTQYADSQRKIDMIITGSLQRQIDSASHFTHAYLNKISTVATSTPDRYTNDAYAKLRQPLIIEALNEFNHRDVFAQLDPSFNTEVGIATAIASAPVPKVRLAQLFNDAMIRWHSGNHDADYMESWSQFNVRAQQALQRIIEYTQQQSVENVLIFTSGGVISAITANLLKQGSMTAYELNLSLINSAVTTVQLKKDKLRLIAFNEHSHLYQQGQSFITYR